MQIINTTIIALSIFILGSSVFAQDPFEEAIRILKSKEFAIEVACEHDSVEVQEICAQIPSYTGSINESKPKNNGFIKKLVGSIEQMHREVKRNKSSIDSLRREVRSSGVTVRSTPTTVRRSTPTVDFSMYRTPDEAARDSQKRADRAGEGR